MLGFKIVYERVDDKFIFLELNGNQIIIKQENDIWNTFTLEFLYGRGINITMTIENVEDLFYYLMMRKYPVYSEIIYNEYIIDGIKYIDKEFLLQDPDGYLLRFCEMQYVILF